MDVESTAATREQRDLRRRLLERYRYDFSEFDGSDVDEEGRYGYPLLDRNWSEEGRHPFLIRVGSRVAGFVLVNRHTLVTRDPGAHSVAEFFVMRKYRRQGVGRAAACRVFVRFPGPWEVREEVENAPAQSFWRRVMAQYTGGRYREVSLADGHRSGPVQLFRSPGLPAGT